MEALTTYEKSGTDRVMIGKVDRKTAKKERGRPEVNRTLALILMKAKSNGNNSYTSLQIMNRLNCSRMTYFRIKKEFEDQGLINSTDENKVIELTDALFDEEMKRATGNSFLSFLKNKSPTHYKSIFSFCETVWNNVFDKPSIMTLKDSEEQLGDQLCQKFLNYFMGGDEKQQLENRKRMRNRLKLIRFMFRYIGRMDLCDKYLTMTESLYPTQVRRVEQIDMDNFPILINQCIEQLTPDEKLIVKCKIVFMARTGRKISEKGITGLRKDEGESRLIMNSVDDWRCHLLEKKNEEWDIAYIPRELRIELYERYLTKKPGEFIFDIGKKLCPKWGVITEKIIGKKLILHDMRKISATWYYALGLPLELICDLNVGWKDMNTPKKHYLSLRKLMKKDKRRVYAEQIPSWFKSGIEEYIED